MKPKLAIVTGNPLKYRELSLSLGEFFDCEQRVLSEYHEIQGKPEDIIVHKLHAAYGEIEEAVLVDDTSLHLEELNGFPGPYIRDFLTCFSSYDMGVKFAGGRVSVACRLGFYDGYDTIVGTGIIHGDVVIPAKVDPGAREFDIFIQVDGTDRPMLEFTPEEKNKFSHRGMALKDLIEKLKNK